MLPVLVIIIPVQLMAEIFGVTLELEIFSFPSHMPPLIYLQGSVVIRNFEDCLLNTATIKN